MTDQCKHCTIRGDIKECLDTGCSRHEDWWAVEVLEQLKASQGEVEKITAVGVKALERDRWWEKESKQLHQQLKVAVEALEFIEKVATGENQVDVFDDTEALFWIAKYIREQALKQIAAKGG